MKPRPPPALLLVTLIAAGLGVTGPVCAVTGEKPATDRATARERHSEEEPPSEPGEVDEVDEVLEGFDDGVGEASGDARVELGSGLDLGGAAKLGLSWNVAHRRPAEGRTDWRGLSRLRLTLELEAEQRLSGSWHLVAGGHAFHDLAFAIQGRDGYPQSVLDPYESEFEIDEAFLRGDPNRRVTVTTGRQIVVWGTSETLRVTDVLNPLDLREPGITDIEDLRLPVTMTRVDIAAGRWTVTGMAIHEVRFDKSPAWGHDFYPAELPLPPESVPADSLANTELAAALRGTFRGWDLSLYWADHYDHTPRVELGASGSAAMVHSRLRTLGVAWDLAHGDLLLKAEVAHHRGLGFSLGGEWSQTDTMAGLEYAGLTDASVTFEVVSRHVHGFTAELEQAPDLARQDRLEWVVRASRFVFHQTLTLSLVAITFGADGADGALQRLEARYDLNDALELTGGVVLYQSGDLPGSEDLGDNDRLFLDLVYRF